MTKTNCNQRPVFSCLWLAGIALIGSSSADDISRQPIESPFRIVSQSDQNSKRNMDSMVVNRTDIPEDSRIATGHGFVKASSQIPPRAVPQLASNVPEETKTPIPEDEMDSKNQQEPPTEVTRPLFRSLSAISLAGAGRSESLKGMPLKQPESHAKPMLAAHGTWQDISGYRPTPLPQHNYFATYNNPLYFEDPNLERRGTADGCFTDVVSAVRFFGRIPLVPYMIGSNEPCSCVPSLGNYSPCCGYNRDAYIAPLNARGVALQAACTVGLIFLIP